MKLGDFIEIQYTGKIALTGEVFDDTSKSKNPAFTVMGQKMVPVGVEKQLESMEVGDEREFSVSPDEGFGKRFPQLVKIIPMRDFIKQNINPMPGIFVTIDNRQAKVQSISAGRVRVDFNHPLAGRELIYRMKVVRKLSDPAEMAQKFIDHFGFPVKCSFADGKLTVKLTEQMKNLFEKMFSAKLTSLIPEIKEVVFEIEASPIPQESGRTEFRENSVASSAKKSNDASLDNQQVVKIEKKEEKK